MTILCAVLCPSFRSSFVTSVWFLPSLVCKPTCIYAFLYQVIVYSFCPIVWKDEIIVIISYIVGMALDGHFISRSHSGIRWIRQAIRDRCSVQKNGGKINVVRGMIPDLYGSTRINLAASWTTVSSLLNIWFICKSSFSRHDISSLKARQTHIPVMESTLTSVTSLVTTFFIQYVHWHFFRSFLFNRSFGKQNIFRPASLWDRNDMSYRQGL